MSQHPSDIGDIPPLETICGFTYSPTTDIPFGKRVRIGLQDSLIYQSIIERGYQSGMNAHLQFMEDHQLQDPVILDDKQFTMLIEQILPPGLNTYDQGLWRSYFIVGWTCVGLGIIGDEEIEEEQ